MSISIGPNGNDSIGAGTSNTSVFCGGAPRVCGVACTSGIDGGIKIGGAGGKTGAGIGCGTGAATTGGLGLV